MILELRGDTGWHVAVAAHLNNVRGRTRLKDNPLPRNVWLTTVNTHTHTHTHTELSQHERLDEILDVIELSGKVIDLHLQTAQRVTTAGTCDGRQ